MKKLFYTLCLAAAIPSYAMAYQPFIVEGRVWEYVHVVNANSCLTTVCKTFDGKVDFDGRRYSKFVTFRKSDYPNDRLSGTVVDASESIDRKECYLREKDEQVFILVDEYGETVYDMDFASGDTSGIREALIMDFSLANGEAFPSDCFHNTEYAKEGLFKTELDPVVYFDRSYGKYGICDAGGNEFSPRYAEALGGLNNGIFPDNTLYVAPNMTSEYLLTVTEPDGGTIYRSPSYEWLLHPDFSGRVRTVREDRVWEYVYNIGEVWNQMFRLKFEGKEEHEGRTYHRLVHTGDLVGWKSDYDYDKDEYVTWGREDSPNDNDMVYLMREEEGRVYLLNSNMGESLDWAFDPQPAPKEVLIYDFNMKAGESYNLLAGIWDWNSEPEWHCTGDWAQCEIISTDTVEIDGEECIVQNASFVLLNNLKIIDGIGFAEHGFLPFLCCDMRTTLFRSNYNLNRVYNAAGEVIYRGLDIDPETVSVDAIETLPSTTLSYDGVSVQAVNPAGNSITLSLLDISGTLMSRSEGSETAVASTAALTPGVYVAIAQADGATVTRRKFVVR